ncbi:MAG: small subunit ribosomal protein S2 [Parcubacteria group bacterium Gr01-1014_29]|nr:MAG: small subunit ribosomal protein S2 [Parcubacteria group bacterium Gr01-1014_29]
MRHIALYGIMIFMVETSTMKDIPVPGMAVNPEITALYQAGVHFGYAKTRRHPKMRQYIFGTKSNVEVFDLFKVLPKLQETLDALRVMGQEGKTFLFVGTKASAKEAIRIAAQELGMPYVTERWLGGTLTNFKVITDRVQYWLTLRQQQESGELKKYTKHEQTKLAQEINKLEYMFKGIEGMKHIPHALVVIDLKEESLAVREAERRGVSVIALSNTDTDPSCATYIIPGNDNAKASIAYILQRIVQAYKEGVAMQVAETII